MPSTRRGASTTHHASSTPDPVSGHTRPLTQETVPTPSQDILSLRRDWRFAAVCQFIFTFDEAIQVKEFETEEFEDDLTVGTAKILPQLMHRLLHVLTFDRRITPETWEHYLRIQFERREPDAPLLGTEEEPVDWSSLSAEQRLVAIHTITEWHMANPGKIRKMMKDEENNFLWRVEPVGRDAQHNTYWLFDDNRLWIQRALPKPVKSASKKKTATDRQPPAKKRKVSPSKTASKLSPAPAKSSRAERNGDSRYPKRSAVASSKESQSSPTPLATTRSTRASRFRSVIPVEEDGWQKIPEELLKESAVEDVDDEPVVPDDASVRHSQVNGHGSAVERTAISEEVLSKGSRKRPFAEDDSDEESELTELSESDEEADKQAVEADIKMEDALLDNPAGTAQLTLSLPLSRSRTVDASGSANDGITPAGFVEWETICVTLYEWENIPERFSQSNNREEKTFHKLLVDEVCPRVLKELRAIERLKKTSMALEHRKRSARIATRELEKEAQRLEEQKRAEEDAQNQRAKRHEQRMARQEAEQLERERKKREREERAARGRQRDMWQKDHSEGDTPNAKSESEDGEEKKNSTAPTTDMPLKAKPVNRAVPTDEPWELDCEICKAKGFNLDDGSKITCCETCNKWQHTACHDKADAEAGRPKRRWSAVTFKCKACKNKRRRDRYAERAQAERLAQEQSRLDQQHNQNNVAINPSPVVSANGLKLYVAPANRPLSAHPSPVANGMPQARPPSSPSTHNPPVHLSHPMQSPHGDYVPQSYETSNQASRERPPERRPSQSQPVQIPAPRQYHIQRPVAQEANSATSHHGSYSGTLYPSSSGYAAQTGYQSSSRPSEHASTSSTAYAPPYAAYASSTNGYTYSHSRTSSSPGWASQEYSAYYGPTSRQYTYGANDSQHGPSSTTYGAPSGKHQSNWSTYTQQAQPHAGPVQPSSAYGVNHAPDRPAPPPVMPRGAYGPYPNPNPQPPPAYPAEAQARQ